MVFVPTLSEEDLRKAVVAVEMAIMSGAVYPAPSSSHQLRSAVAEASAALEIPRITLCRRLWVAWVRLGLGPNGIAPNASYGLARAHRPLNEIEAAARHGAFGAEPVQPGFEMAESTVTRDKTGAVVRSMQRQKRAPGPEYAAPAGHLIKGESTFVDGSGRVVGRWIKTRADAQAGLALVEAVKMAMRRVRRAEPLPAPALAAYDLLTVYPIADLHLGLYAWSRDSGGDYDLDIASRLLTDTMSRLVADSPASAEAVVLGLGDFFHADDQNNRTPRSGHPLDVDSRYAKVLTTGIDLMIAAIDLARRHHMIVRVRNLPGNHDPHMSYALTYAIRAYFRNDPRVIVDDAPDLFWWHEWGRCLLGATHGHETRPDQAQGVMAARQPEAWGRTLRRHMFFGHVHHKSKGGGEANGMSWETVQTLAPRDAWHQGKGFTSGRSMEAVTYHKLRGELSRRRENVA